MPLRQLPKEVWTLIAWHVRQPVPQPRRLKGRKEVRQVDLVNLMTVSKLFNNAVAPALYHTIITDDIAGLFLNYKYPNAVAPGILSKRELLRLTRALYLEYPERPLSEVQERHPLRYRLPHALRDPGTRDKSEGDLGFYIRHPALGSLIDSELIFACDPSAQLQNSMPELRSLSTGTFFGTYEDGWNSKFGGSLGYGLRTNDIQRVYSRMLLSGKITHFCQSGNYSPLSIHPRALSVPRPPSPLHTPLVSGNAPAVVERTITLHVNLKDYKAGANLSLIFKTSFCIPGVRIRWCFDNPRQMRSTGTKIPFLGFSDLPFLAFEVYSSLADGLEERHAAYDKHPQSSTVSIIPFTVDAYIPINDSTATMLLQGDKVTNPRGASAKEKTANKRRAAAQKLEDAMGTELFKTDVETKVLHPDDRLGIHYIADCPACPACGWLPVE